MVEVRKTDIFLRWLEALNDQRAKARIVTRLDRIAYGLLGDTRSVGEGVQELCIDYGPGYRVYFVQRGETVIVLLCAGDKRTQDKDIKNAKVMAAELKS
jgi:putative addiction module killer protein